MCFFAIRLGKNRRYMLVKFNVEAERETFIKHNPNFREIKNSQVRSYIDPKVFHLCNGRQRVVFDNNGACIGRINSLYKDIFAQPIDRPEDSAIPNAPIARRKTIVNGTTAHNYKTTL